MRAVRRLLWVWVLSTGAAFVSLHSVEAADNPLPRPIRIAGGMSLDQAVEMVERRFHARVIRAEAREENGHTIYVLRLLNDAGRVWIVRVDSVSGAVQ